MSYKLICNFQVKRTDPLGIRRQENCGEPAGMYRCKGELTSTDILLCDRHKSHVVNQYKWKVEKMNDYRDESEHGV